MKISEGRGGKGRGGERKRHKIYYPALLLQRKVNAQSCIEILGVIIMIAMGTEISDTSKSTRLKKL